MRRAFVAVLLATAVSACGGSDPVAACKSMAEALCNRTFDCFPTGSQQFYGTVADCTTTLSGQVCTPEKTTCPAGLHFSSSNAEQCISDYRNESCDELLNGNVPASCNSRCTP